MFSFRLTTDFVDDYRAKPVPWGYTDVAGNSVGEITFMRTYSRIKEDGSKEDSGRRLRARGQRHVLDPEGSLQGESAA
jgi:hypothetical protein